MNIIYLSILFNLFTFASSSCNINYRYGQKLKIKFIIFKEKKYPKLINDVKTSCKLYYEKSIGIMSDYMNEYDKISDEDKAIIEFIISTIL